MAASLLIRVFDLWDVVLIGYEFIILPKQSESTPTG
jgi:hypothetical protein